MFRLRSVGGVPCSRSGESAGEATCKGTGEATAARALMREELRGLGSGYDEE
jgi:hypothetical protein